MIRKHEYIPDMLTVGKCLMCSGDRDAKIHQLNQDTSMTALKAKDMTNVELARWIDGTELDPLIDKTELTEDTIAGKSLRERISIFEEIAARLRAIGEPTNWRVRDYGDGWIGYSLERDAREQAERTGALMQAVYAVTLPQPPKEGGG